MKFGSKIFPTNTRMTFRSIALVLVAMQINRLLFFGFNSQRFLEWSFSDVLVSLYFDITTVGLLFLPFVFFAALPITKYRNLTFYRVLLAVLFYGSLTFVLAADLMDVVYFSYTGKRSTSDLFALLQMGSDLNQQFGSFVKDFWWLALVFVLEVGAISYFRKYVTRPNFLVPSSWLKEALHFVVVLALAIVAGRGGFGFRPVSPLTASQYTSSENVPLVLNTAFTLVKSYGKEALELKDYYTEEEELALFNPIKKTVPLQLLPDKTNVVLIILESFGSEWVGAAGAEKSFTPFIDSLAEQGLFFRNGIANGKKSIEAVPSILASIPSLMETPYISSPYATNALEALPQVLAKQGYESSFFHGATNGSMNFDVFASKAGFDHYYGRKEYNNEAHFDGTWGILDEYFNPWMADVLKESKKPFFATLFTLSSHHPYYIPKKYKGRFPEGPNEICQSIAYADWCLQQFFKHAQQMPWYQNTLFVFCADHSSASVNPIYNQTVNLFKIPILYYHPSGALKSEISSRLHQQIDIYPTILDLLNIDTKIYSYGNSHFQNTKEEAITYLNSGYNYYFDNYMLTFSGEKARNLYASKVQNAILADSLEQYRKRISSQEARLKALIQRYNRDLILNQTLVNEKEN